MRVNSRLFSLLGLWSIAILLVLSSVPVQSAPVGSVNSPIDGRHDAKLAFLSIGGVTDKALEARGFSDLKTNMKKFQEVAREKAAKTVASAAGEMAQKLDDVSNKVSDTASNTVSKVGGFAQEVGKFTDKQLENVVEAAEKVADGTKAGASKATQKAEDIFLNMGALSKAGVELLEELADDGKANLVDLFEKAQSKGADMETLILESLNKIQGNMEMVKNVIKTGGVPYLRILKAVVDLGYTGQQIDEAIWTLFTDASDKARKQLQQADADIGTFQLSPKIVAQLRVLRTQVDRINEITVKKKNGDLQNINFPYPYGTTAREYLTRLLGDDYY